MKKKTLLTLLLIAFNKLMIAITKPLTKVDLFAYTGEKNRFNLKGVPTWLAMKKIDQLILTSILTYGVKQYKNKSLYEITSAYDLAAVLNLIKHGIIKKDDFQRHQPGLTIPSSAITHFKHGIFEKEWDAIRDNDTDLKEKARAASDNQKDYDSLMYDFTFYKYDLMKHNKLNERIDNMISSTGISIYLNQNLYDITDLSFYFEAEDAAELMDTLIYIGIDKWNGVALRDLSLFTLEKCNAAYENRDFSLIEFNPVTRAAYEEDLKKDLQSDADNEKRKKRNAAAKLRRDTKKAEKQSVETLAYINKKSKELKAEIKKRKTVVITYSKKAHGEKIRNQIAENDAKQKADKAAMKVIKSATAQPAKKVAPVKKIQPKKTSKRKTS